MKRSTQRLQRRKFVLLKSFAMWNVFEIAVSNFHHNTNLLSISTIILFMCNKNTNIYFPSSANFMYWAFIQMSVFLCWNFMWANLQKFIVYLIPLLSEFHVLSVFRVSEFTEIYSVLNSLVERISCIERFSCEQIYRNLYCI